MTKSETSKNPRKSLTTILNDLWSSSKQWRINGWNDVEGKKFKLSVNFDTQRIDIEKGMDCFPKRELVMLCWNAGMIPSANEEQVNAFIESALNNPGNRTIAIAMDTNLIYNRFYPNYMSRYHSRPYDSKPHFVVLCEGTDHEIHYKMSYTIRKGKFTTKFLEMCKQNKTPYDILTGKSYLSEGERLNPLLRIPSRQGRLGVKGLREVRRLQEKYPVILSKPGHLYYSEKIQTEGKFIDAVFDSLIRYEADFIRKNSNTRILFLTSDKHQYQSAESEGLEAHYIKPPTKSSALFKIDPDCFRLGYIEKFIEEILVFSPYIKLEAADSSLFLASAWDAMGADEAREGVMKCIIGKDESTIECG